MARQHGIVYDTYDRIIIDSGAVYKNYGETSELLLGATRGGSSFVIEQEIRNMEVDGARGPVKGGRRVTNVMARITANFIEINSDILQLALPGSSVANYGTPTTHEKITRALSIALTDYCTNIAIVGEVSGSAQPFVGIIKNVIADGNLEINMADKDESVIAVTFTAHFTASDLDTEPWEIRYPDDVLATTTTAGA